MPHCTIPCAGDLRGGLDNALPFYDRCGTNGNKNVKTNQPWAEQCCTRSRRLDRPPDPHNRPSHSPPGEINQSGQSDNKSVNSINHSINPIINQSTNESINSIPGLPVIILILQSDTFENSLIVVPNWKVVKRCNKFQEDKEKTEPKKN
jgi:hypothetical protein